MVGLVQVPRSVGARVWVRRAAALVRHPGRTSGASGALEDPLDRPQRRPRLDTLEFELPGHRVRAAALEAASAGEAIARGQHRAHDGGRRAPRLTLRRARARTQSCRPGLGEAALPLREPLAAAPEGLADLARSTTLAQRSSNIDLERIDDATVTGALTSPALLEAFRYLPGPPISKDDLKELAQTSLSVKALKNPSNARSVVRTVLAGLDRRRFPWVSEDREPSEAERETSIVASAALIASQRRATERRNDSKALQEASVFATLESVGFRRVAPRRIRTLSDAPEFGEFCSESMLGSRKADVVVRVWDHRVLAIECKVSNSSTNSIKRLNNDAAAKAGVWLDQFGTEQLVPSATLTGVFKLSSLVSAQGRRLTLFWAHDLGTMTDWIERTRAG